MNGKQLKNSILQWAIQGKLVPPACRQAGKTLTTNPKPRIEGIKCWFTYVIECEGGSFYKGYTDDLLRRYRQHCNGTGAQYTKDHKPKQLYYWEMHYSEEAALEREKYLKSGVGREWFKNEVVNKPENFEPASVLLEKIRQEKERLIKDLSADRQGKKIKRDKNASIIFRGEDNSYYEKVLATGEVKCIDEEIPFDLPNGWEWERWGNISQSIQYGYNAPALEHGVIKMVRISDIQENKVLWDSVPYCQIEENDIDTYLLKANDILFARTGGTVGKSFLVETVPQRAIYAGYLIRTRYSSLLNPRYMKSFMESQLYWEQLKNGTIATAQPNCNGKTLAKMLLPIPPYSEQHRIVSKIQELEPLVERYGKSEEALGKLNAAVNELLKKSILQDAIQGRLVPQVESEGTATDLLEEIKTEKQKLVKEGKLKKSALVDSIIYKGDDNRYWEKVGNEKVCIDDDIQLQIPATWTWCRIKDLLDIQTGAAFKKEQVNTIKQGVRILRGGNILPNKYVFKDDDVFVASDFINDKTLLHKGDIITPAVTSLDNIGKMAVIDKDLNAVSAGGFVFIISPYHSDYTHSLLIAYFLQSPYIIEAMKSITKKSGAAFYNIGKERLKELYMPLPPLAEQQRIVAQIEKLFAALR